MLTAGVIFVATATTGAGAAATGASAATALGAAVAEAGLAAGALVPPTGFVETVCAHPVATPKQAATKPMKKQIRIFIA